ncbi:Arf family GTPase ARL3 SCDLUD_001967 [Saccharomycodes ludwigii]|uniref:Arf family GTPase ARL3 n=1 Tax=Saccharomycodes ludwigii TaxID=36035 RepID=UPI001E866B14|nr:hypothetical protein SCDLUD_001967 [Saccharomycodes ludwigii]KAH3902154.1 hypothetical protein SCDLUD_001967 [Saccharomycodes ludwigii]
MKSPQYSVLILGLDNAGKTTFLESLKNQYNQQSKPLDKITPTVGQNVGVIHLPANSCNLKFWDVGGQQNLRKLWPSYYAQCHGIIFIVDSSDKLRLNECKEVFLNMVIEDDQLSDSGIPILMLANKQDKEDSLEVQDIKEIFNKIAEKLDASDSRVLPISALTSKGVKESIDWLIVRMQRNKKNRPPTYR